jgi:hypothetical protein
MATSQAPETNLRKGAEKATPQAKLNCPTAGGSLKIIGKVN